MSATNFKDLIRHVGHKIVIATYGEPPVNVAIECETCNEVLLDYDRNPLLIPLQSCKDCNTKYEWEPELAECPTCHSKRIEFVPVPLGVRNPIEYLKQEAKK